MVLLAGEPFDLGVGLEPGHLGGKLRVLLVEESQLGRRERQLMALTESGAATSRRVTASRASRRVPAKYRSDVSVSRDRR